MNFLSNSDPLLMLCRSVKDYLDTSSESEKEEEEEEEEGEDRRRRVRRKRFALGVALLSCFDVHGRGPQV
jgi:hypothetical protein